jgi:NADH-quinone oxidoreductase subunit M
MEEILDHWGPSLAVFIPLVGAAVMMLIPRENEDSHKGIALVTSLACFAVLIGVAVFFDFDHAGTLQYEIDKEWIPVIDSRYHIGVDGLSLPLLLLTGLILPLVIIYSWNHIPEPGNAKAFLILMLVLQTGMVGTFVAQDLILFFVFFEVVLLPMYFMIGVWGGEQRMYAAIKFFLYTAFGSAFMLIAFLALYFLSETPDGGHTFQITELPAAATGIASTTAWLIFGGMFLGFGIKVPMFPFHTWLPDAHTQAPTQGSVILAAVMLKLGTYGFIRIPIPILPDAARDWAPIIGVLAAIGIIYGALGCLAQTDMKRLIAFSSVAHMGYTMLGIATLTDFGMNAAVMGMVAHGLITGMLFFIAGSVKERYHTLEIKRLGGLLVSAPRLGWILAFCSMASLGLPGLAGFWGEFPAILAAYEPADGLSVELFRTLMVVAAVGTVFAAGYLLWLLQRTAFGTPKEEWEGHHFHDVETPEWLAWTPLLILIVALGIYPNFVFEITDGGVQQALSAFTGGG